MRTIKGFATRDGLTVEFVRYDGSPETAKMIENLGADVLFHEDGKIGGWWRPAGSQDWVPFRLDAMFGRFTTAAGASRVLCVSAIDFEDEWTVLDRA